MIRGLGRRSDSMVRPGDGPDDAAGRLVFRDEIGNRLALAAVPEEGRRHRHHGSAGINAVHLLRVLPRCKATDAEAVRLLVRRTIINEV